MGGGAETKALALTQRNMVYIKICLFLKLNWHTQWTQNHENVCWFHNMQLKAIGKTTVVMPISLNVASVGTS